MSGSGLSHTLLLIHCRVLVLHWPGSAAYSAHGAPVPCAQVRAVEGGKSVHVSGVGSRGLNQLEAKPMSILCCIIVFIHVHAILCSNEFIHHSRYNLWATLVPGVGRGESETDVWCAFPSMQNNLMCCVISHGRQHLILTCSR